MSKLLTSGASFGLCESLPVRVLVYAPFRYEFWIMWEFSGASFGLPPRLRTVFGTGARNGAKNFGGSSPARIDSFCMERVFLSIDTKETLNWIYWITIEFFPH